MKPDTILQSLAYGRLAAATLAGVSGTTIAVTTMTGTVDQATLMLTAILNAVSVIAAIVSKLREIRGK